MLLQNEACKVVKVWQRVQPLQRVLSLSPFILRGTAGMAVGIGLPSVTAGVLICVDGM